MHLPGFIYILRDVKWQVQWVSNIRVPFKTERVHKVLLRIWKIPQPLSLEINPDEGNLQDEDIKRIIETGICIDIFWLSKGVLIQASTISLK